MEVSSIIKHGKPIQTRNHQGREMETISRVRGGTKNMVILQRDRAQKMQRTKRKTGATSNKLQRFITKRNAEK